MFYKLISRNGHSRIINLKSIVSIELNKRTIRFNYSVPSISGIALIMNTTLLNNEYVFDTTADAEKEYATIEAFIQQGQKMVRKELQ